MSTSQFHITPHIRLLRPLGEGGMGSVWVAEHLGLRTHIAVKFLSESLAKNPHNVARFQREAASASHVKSPHVVQMIDHGIAPNGIPYIAMELLEGRDLAHLITERAPLTPRETITIIAQVAKALGRAHERGVIHRDVKPDNIFLCDIGHGETFVKVLDFGIAKVGDASDFSATKTGVAIGTPYYMSPEQVIGAKTIDARTDVWSLGIVAYECLTGRRPFDAQTIGALSIAICQGEIALPTHMNPALSPAVDTWFLRACARNPGARFSTVRELVDELDRALWSSLTTVEAMRTGSVPPAQPPVNSWTQGSASHSATPAFLASAPARPNVGAPAVTTLGNSATTRSASSARGSSARVPVLAALVTLGAIAGIVLYVRSHSAEPTGLAPAKASAEVAGTGAPVTVGAALEAQPTGSSSTSSSAESPSALATAPSSGATSASLASSRVAAAAPPPPSVTDVAPKAVAPVSKPRGAGVTTSATTSAPPKKKHDIDIR